MGGDRERVEEERDAGAMGKRGGARLSGSVVRGVSWGNVGAWWLVGLHPGLVWVMCVWCVCAQGGALGVCGGGVRE